MKKGKISFTLLFFTLSFYCFAQNNIKPQDIKLVTELKAKYKDAKIVSLKSVTEYSFDLDSKSEVRPVTAFEKNTDNFISLKDNYDHVNVVFYDEQSSIDKPYAKAEHGRPVSLMPVEKTYEENGIFCNDVKMIYYSLNFETRGQRMESGYNKGYYDVKYLTSAYFHESYPIEEKIISFTVPSWLTVELKEENFEGYDIEKKTQVNAKDKTTTYSFTAHNLQAYKHERHAPNRAKNYPHILILCKNYTSKDGSRKQLFETVQDLYNWYYSLVQKINNKPEEIKPTVERLITGKKTDVEKVEAIFYWVQENIRYIAFENGIMGYKPESAQNVFKNKYGDCKGKANLTREMLKLAGFDAHLTWIGTNDIPYDYSVPSLAVDNHMICTLILNDKKYFLDATEDYIAFNDYAHRIQGRQVLIENGSGKYILDHVPEFGADRNKEENTIKLSLVDDVLKGSVKTIYNGEQKTNILRGYASVRSDNQEEALKKYLASNDKNLKLSNVKSSDLQDRQNPLSFNYDLEISNYVTKVGKEIYVNVDKDKEFVQMDLDSERVNDYEFNNKILIVSHYELSIPSGYKVDYLPQAVTLKHPDFSFSLSYKQAGNKITYEKKITIDNAVIHKKDFREWNSTVKDIKKFYNDQIVLVKTS
jgi:hypothetical protein